MIYNRDTAHTLPPDPSYDHAVYITHIEQPMWGPICALSEKDLSVIKDYLEETLDARSIHPRSHLQVYQY
jgi:hypothetical protein